MVLNTERIHNSFWRNFPAKAKRMPSKVLFVGKKTRVGNSKWVKNHHFCAQLSHRFSIYKAIIHLIVVGLWWIFTSLLCGLVNREVTKRQRRRQRERLKSKIGLDKQNNNFTRTFLCRRCTTTTWNCLISRFVEDGNKRQLSFSLPELWCRPSEFISKKFANIWRTERDGTSAIKFEAAQIHFLSDVFVAVVVPSTPYYPSPATFNSVNNCLILIYFQLSRSFEVKHHGDHCWWSAFIHFLRAS